MNNSTGKKKHLSFKGEEKKAKLRVTYVTVESQGRMRETTLRDVSWAALAMRPSLTMEQMNLDGVWILSYRTQAWMASNCISKTPNSFCLWCCLPRPWMTSLWYLRIPVVLSPASLISVYWWLGRHLVPTVKQINGTRRWLRGPPWNKNPALLCTAREKKIMKYFIQRINITNAITGRRISYRK